MPIGIGALRKIHSRVVWMLRPVERSITVSAPQRIARTILSTSSSTEDVTAELPILALIFVKKLRPMIIGSSSAWLMLQGMIARPRAISERTNSGVMKAGTLAPKLSPSASADSARSSCVLRPRFSRSATKIISLVMMPARANSSCVIMWPSSPRSGLWKASNAFAALSAETLPLSTGLIARPSYSSTPPRSLTQAMRLRGRPALTSIVTFGSV